ncbi:hypothetical protein EGW08_007263, partial [Elysia chlorotica]
KAFFPKSTSDRVAFLFLLFAIHSIAFFELFAVLPSIYSTHEHVASNGQFNLYFFHIFIGVFVYASVMINLKKIITTNTSTRGLVLPTQLKPGWKFCSVCECNSPPRSFHCFNCSSCILNRDHHCTFTGNCIGLYNRRYYLSLLMSMCVAAGYSVALNYDYMYHIFGSISLKSVLTIMFPMISWIFVRTESVTSFQIFMCSLCIVGFLLSAGLLAYHMMNVLNGQVVFERSYNIDTYNLGWRENLALVFGTKWKVAWLCPLIVSPIPSDGLEYVTQAQYER